MIINDYFVDFNFVQIRVSIRGKWITRKYLPKNFNRIPTIQISVGKPSYSIEKYFDDFLIGLSIVYVISFQRANINFPTHLHPIFPPLFVVLYFLFKREF